MTRALRGLALLGIVALATEPARGAGEALERADALWAQRAAGQVEGKAQPGPSRAAIAAYEDALAEAPDSLQVRWKLLRALWFSADFATDDTAARRATYERAIAVADDGFRELASRTGGAQALADAPPAALRARLDVADRRDAARLYFWYAVNLGAWSRIAGLLEAVRTGVANRLHEATLRSIALDPDVEQGGAIRLLSRLHSELPRVPLLSGWVDHERAVPLAERAASEYPDHPGNAYLLGLAILSNEPSRREEALALVEATAALEPRPEQLVEDLAIRIDARKRLASEAGAS